MANEALQIGDVVKLKSGSPLMTIVSLDNGWIQCVWYVNGEMKISTSIPLGAVTTE